MKATKSEQRILTLSKKAFIISILLISFSCTYAGKVISGKITDEAGSPLPGAAVQIKGSILGVITDLNGKYSINTPDSNAILIFSYIGYLTEEIPVRNAKNLNITLKADISDLEEVIVIGYGTQKKSVVTGAISSVNSASLPSMEYRRAEKALQGKCAGVNIVGDQSYSNQIYYNPSTETYSSINENGFKTSKANPLSTFSIDVDRASYSNIKRFLNNGQMPPADAVRIEEMINYFEYDYPQPTGEHPFSINTEYANCPWAPEHRLLQIGIQGKKIATENLPASNLVFLLDVSGSMAEANKLPLLKSAFKLLVNNLRENDRVAIIVYAGAAGLVLPSTCGNNKQRIYEALDNLQAGGSTAGAAGIQLAYQVAKEHFVHGGNNRVILATDGDFNVGTSNDNELEDLITNQRKTGIYLTCLGFGMGNYKDSKMEILADKGNGNYAYINDIQEANKTLVSEFGGTLFTIAKDVKIQIEFNPAKVQAYRLIGYENRMLNEEDFKDDAKDAGELGSGHTVTALYEIIPVGVKSEFTKDVDPLKYQKPETTSQESVDNEVATVKFRYKKPDGDKSIEMVQTIADKAKNIDNSSENLRFSSSVAMFGMILRNSEFKGSSSLAEVVELANGAKGFDKEGYRAEFVRLVKTTDNGAYKLSQK